MTTVYCWSIITSKTIQFIRYTSKNKVLYYIDKFDAINRIFTENIYFFGLLYRYFWVLSRVSIDSKQINSATAVHPISIYNT